MKSSVPILVALVATMASAALGVRDDADVEPRQTGTLPDCIIVWEFVRRVGGPGARTQPALARDGVEFDFDHAELVDGARLFWVNERQRFARMVRLAPHGYCHLPERIREVLMADPCNPHCSYLKQVHLHYVIGEGYVAPFFGKLYRVEKSDGKAFILQAPQQDDLPRSVVVDPDSVAFPTATFGGCIGTIRMSPDLCEQDVQGPFAELTCFRQSKKSDFVVGAAPVRTGDMETGVPYNVRLRPGEYLETPAECGLYRVRRVVPFDREARIWGWIEFDPLPTVPKNAEEQAKLIIRRPVRK